MNCTEFQEVLPHIIESGGNAQQEAHLQSCDSCAALVRDLKYIAEQAKLLLPMYDPNPRVWKNIEESLQREGLLEGRMSRQGQITKQPPISKQTKNRTVLTWTLTLAAAIALVIVLVNRHPTTSAQAPVAGNATPSSVFDNDDQKLVNQLAQQQPDLGSAYENSLREVNTYIADARKAANENPDDPVIQEHLRHAYHQKSVLYEMATVRSLE